MGLLGTNKAIRNEVIPILIGKNTWQLSFPGRKQRHFADSSDSFWSVYEIEFVTPG